MSVLSQHYSPSLVTGLPLIGHTQVGDMNLMGERPSVGPFGRRQPDTDVRTGAL